VLDENTSVELQQKMSKMLMVTGKYHREFNLTGVKKDATLDMWVLEMREC